MTIENLNLSPKFDEGEKLLIQQLCQNYQSRPNHPFHY